MQLLQVMVDLVDMSSITLNPKLKTLNPNLTRMNLFHYSGLGCGLGLR